MTGSSEKGERERILMYFREALKCGPKERSERKREKYKLSIISASKNARIMGMDTQK